MSTTDRLTFAGVVVGVIIFIWTVAVYVVDRRRDAVAAKPQLESVSAEPQNGDLILTLRNSSNETPAAISEFRFVITEQASLEKVEQKYPIPKEFTYEMSRNDRVDVIFAKGAWFAKERYEFWKPVEYHVEAGMPNSFRLGIADDKLANTPLVGTVYAIVRYNNSELPCRFENIVLRAKRNEAYDNSRDD